MPIQANSLKVLKNFELFRLLLFLLFSYLVHSIFVSLLLLHHFFVKFFSGNKFDRL